MTNKIRYKLLPGFSSNLDSFIVFQTVYLVQFPMTLSCNWHRTQYSLSGRKLYRLSSLLLAFYNSLVTDCFCLPKTEDRKLHFSFSIGTPHTFYSSSLWSHSDGLYL